MIFFPMALRFQVGQTQRINSSVDSVGDSHNIPVHVRDRKKALYIN